MSNSYIKFKQFTIHQQACAMKVCTDACVFGAWVARYFTTKYKQPKFVLDVGAGTGLLSLMLQQQLLKASIDAVEIDELAVHQAKENAQTATFKQQIQFYHQHFLAYQPTKAYQLIVSNPPFYENQLKSNELKKNIAHHSNALTINQLIHHASTMLQHKGFMALLIPFQRYQEIESALQQMQFCIVEVLFIKHHQHTAQIRACILAKYKTDEATIISPETMSIYDGTTYSAKMIDLLKPYYLFL